MAIYEDVPVPETLSVNKNDILENLRAIVDDRIANPKEGSYTNKLLSDGTDRILKKVGEEAAEVIIAAKNEGNKELIWEISDLLYHLTLLMADRGVSLGDIRGELDGRKK